MPQELDLPIIGPAYRNVDETGLPQSVGALVMDGVVNELDWTVRRPGLTQFCSLGTNATVDGLYWWDEARTVLAVSQGKIFTISQTGSVTNVTGSALNASGAVTFASFSASKIFMANAGQMVTYTGSGTTTYEPSAQAPTNVSHVAFYDLYILANSVGTGQFFYCNVNAPDTWLASNVFTAEGEPDPLQALHVYNRELYLFGRTSLEIWYDDGQTPFSRLPGVYIERGISAPYSLCNYVTQVANTYLWLDQHRRLVRLNNRTPEAVSIPFDRVLANLGTVSDARGFLLQVDNMPLYVLTFPTEQRTLVYNLLRNDWHEWGYWDTTLGDYTNYLGSSSCYAKDWNLHLVGDRSNGTIYTASRSVFTDNGNPIRTFRRTPQFTHGTMQKKRSSQTIYSVKRPMDTDGVTTPTPQFWVRKNKNGLRWGTEHYYDLGSQGDGMNYVRDRGNGVYRTLQLEIGCSDNCDFQLVGGKELVEVLG